MALIQHPKGYWYGNAWIEDKSVEMKANANYIRGLLESSGWSFNAICGMLGNIQTESKMNPGIWQGLNEGNRSGGYGLTQWTPCGTKYLDWCDSQGLIYHEMESNIARINYEVENGLQWVRRGTFDDMTFRQFKTSDKTPYELAKVFVACYEIPQSWIDGGESREQVYKQRGEQANYWYEYLSGVAPPGSRPNKKSMSLPVFLAATRRRLHVVR